MKPKDYFDGGNLALVLFIPINCTRILEIGCAGGILGETILSERDCEYWGVEQDEAAASAASKRLTRVIHADVESISKDLLPENYFDCIVLGDVLEHLDDPESLLKRLRRHLQKDAHLVANVPNIAHWSIVVEQLRGDFPYHDSGLLDRTHRTFFTPKSLREMLWRCGFIVRKEQPTYVVTDHIAVLADAAERMGLPRRNAEESLSTYQILVQADSHPSPEHEPTKQAILVRSRVPLGDAVLGKSSIIVVTFNSEPTIEDCISSLTGTIGELDEVVVVDNCSQDRTLELLKKMAALDSRIRLIRNGANLGFSRATNKGILSCVGEFIVLANPDTVLYDGWLESFKLHLSDPTCGAVGPVSDVVAGAQNIHHRTSTGRPSSLVAFAEDIRTANFGDSENSKLLIGFCLGVRREVLAKVGLLDEAMFLGADDLEFSWRLQCLGYRLVIALDVFVHHRHHTSFNSLHASESERLIRESDYALKAKLKEYYGELGGVDSTCIWGLPIFHHILDS